MKALDIIVPYFKFFTGEFRKTRNETIFQNGTLALISQLEKDPEVRKSVIKSDNSTLDITLDSGENLPLVDDAISIIGHGYIKGRIGSNKVSGKGPLVTFSNNKEVYIAFFSTYHEIGGYANLEVHKIKRNPPGYNLELIYTDCSIPLGFSKRVASIFNAKASNQSEEVNFNHYIDGKVQEGFFRGSIVREETEGTHQASGSIDFVLYNGTPQFTYKKPEPFPKGCEDIDHGRLFAEFVPRIN